MANQVKELTPDELALKLDEMNKREQRLRAQEAEFEKQMKQAERNYQTAMQNVQETLKIERDQTHDLKEKIRELESRQPQNTEESNDEINTSEANNANWGNIDINEQMNELARQIDNLHRRINSPTQINESLNSGRERPNDRNVITPYLMQELLQRIPRFNGRNLFEFMQAIKRIKDQFPLNLQPEITGLLKLKLDNNVAAAMGNRQYQTIDVFITKLRNTFATSQTSTYYRGQLSKLSIKNHNNILEYIGRVTELRAAIADCICMEKDYDELTPHLETKLDKEVIKEFVYGLTPEYRNHMVGCGFDVELAFERAIRAEKRMKMDNERHGTKNTNKRQFNRENFVRRDTPRGREYRENHRNQNDRDNIVRRDTPRDREYRENHRNQNNRDNRNQYNGQNISRDLREYRDSREFRGNYHTNNQNQYREQSRNHNHGRYDPNAECRYCKRPGHSIENCYSRRNNEARRAGNGEAARETTDVTRGTVNQERPVNYTMISENSETSTTATQ